MATVEDTKAYHNNTSPQPEAHSCFTSQKQLHSVVHKCSVHNFHSHIPYSLFHYLPA